MKLSFTMFKRMSLIGSSVSILLLISGFAFTKSPGGNPGFFMEAPVNNNLKSAPAFGASSYFFTAQDNLVVGSPAGIVNASDPEGDAITYAIKTGNTNNTFTINITSGAITVAKLLNHHTQDTFQLIVTAKDPGGLSNQTMVTIAVVAGNADPRVDSLLWGTAASQPYTVNEAQGEVVNGQLYTFGGFDSQKPSFTPTSRAYAFNPVANTWAAIAAMPPMNGTGYGGVTHAGFTTDGTDIYFAGGYTSNSAGTGQKFGTKEVWKYIVAENRYVRLPDLPIAVAAGQMDYLAGKLHHISGTNAARTLDLGDHYVLNLDSLSAGWKTLAPVPNPRQHAGSVVYKNRIYYIGGQHGQDGNLSAQKDVHCYNPSTNTWTKLADLPVPAGASGRGHISSSTIIIGDQIVVMAGETVHQTGRTNMVSSYDPETNTWKNLAPLPQSRYSGVGANLYGIAYYTGGSGTKVTYKGTPVFVNSEQQTITLLPAADAFVKNGNYSSQNFGTQPSLELKGSPTSGFTRYAYLQFALPTVPNINSASLRLYGRNTSSSETIIISTYAVSNDAWTEGGLTYNNAPAASATVLGSAGVSNVGKYYDFNLAAFAQSELAGDRIITIMVKDPATSDKNVVFNSRENSQNRPQLVLTTSPQGNRVAIQSTVPGDGIGIVPVIENQVNAARNEKIKVFPNPLHGKFTIEFPGSHFDKYDATITDIEGKIVYSSVISPKPGKSFADIDLSKLSLVAGVYYLRMSANVKTLEIIKLLIQ